MNRKIVVGYLVLLSLLFLSTELFAHGMSAAEKKSIIDGGLLSYLKLGATHMLTGYDHLLFVFGVVFLLSRFIDVLKYVTGFTVGHTVTLILATYTGTKINYFLIDALIALSVCYIAFVNLGGFKRYFNREAPNLLVTVIIIGLVHGVGLSTRLQELPLQKDNLLMQIISFNVGVEIGQVMALTVMLLVLKGLKLLFIQRSLLLVSQASVFALGVYLFFTQMHGYQHQTNPEEFGFNKDGHDHAHIDMEKKRKFKIDVNKKPRHRHSL